MRTLSEKLLRHLDETEGCIPHLYFDHLGNLTIGRGCLLRTAKDVIDLPLAQKTDGVEAGSTSKLSEFNRMQMAPRGKAAAEYARDTRLFLKPEDVENLFKTRCNEIQREMQDAFPFVFDEKFPPSAFEGFFDICFNRGVANTKKKCPKMCAALERGDFETAAAECPLIDTATGDELKQFKRRNKWQVEKFEAAIRERV